MVQTSWIRSQPPAAVVEEALQRCWRDSGIKILQGNSPAAQAGGLSFSGEALFSKFLIMQRMFFSKAMHCKYWTHFDEGESWLFLLKVTISNTRHLSFVTTSLFLLFNQLWVVGFHPLNLCINVETVWITTRTTEAFSSVVANIETIIKVNTASTKIHLIISSFHSHDQITKCNYWLKLY